jgi:hypothetical protein
MFKFSFPPTKFWLFSRKSHVFEKKHSHLATSGCPVDDMPPTQELTLDQSKKIVPQLLLRVKERGHSTSRTETACANFYLETDFTNLVFTMYYEEMLEHFNQMTCVPKKNCCILYYLNTGVLFEGLLRAMWISVTVGRIWSVRGIVPVCRTKVTHSCL